MRRLTLAPALLAATFVLAEPAQAQVMERGTVSSAQRADVADYWTAERMRDAKPAERIINADGSVSKSAAAALPWTSQEVTTPYTNAPTRTHGKVFFTLGGSDYVCSGTALLSSNKSVVWTAGHCVNEGPGAYATNFIFVPAYDSGAAPYGKWTANALYAPTQWVSNGDMTYDTGFAVMDPDSNGDRLTDVVGGSGTAFNQARGLTYTSYGYPAAAPFNGETLKSCTGTASDDPNNPQFGTQGIPCDMTGGSSGGPWFIGIGSDGLQNSINSYGYNGSSVMYGPYWGRVIQDTFKRAAKS